MFLKCWDRFGQPHTFYSRAFNTLCFTSNHTNYKQSLLAIKCVIYFTL